MKGFIYKYQSPTGKVYIGQTINEEYRRKKFLNIKKKYAGINIDNARKKYGPENFKYEILEIIERDNLKELSKELDKLEIYYIGYYDSFKNGYNMSIGGDGSRGYNLTEEHKKKITNYLLKHNPFKGKKHNQKTKDIISKANSRPVVQINPETNEIVKRFNSAKEAGESFGKPRGNSEIIKVCKKYVSPQGKRYITALGYKWEYDISEGSTTTETTENVME